MGGEHGTNNVLFEVAVFLAAAVLIVPLFHRLKVSPVLGYLLGGVLIGPSALGLIKSPEATAILAELGVVFLLFTVGLELSLDRLKAMRRYALRIGLPQVILCATLITLVALGVGTSVDAAVIAGLALALSSTAIIIQLLSERNEASARTGRATIAVLLVQDIAVAPILVLLTVLSQREGNFLGIGGEALLKGVAAIVLLIVAGRYVLRPVFRLIAATKDQDLFLALTLLAVVITAAFTQQAGLSAALGAFLGGVLMSESEFRHQIESKLEPFAGLLLGVFFTSVGIQLDLASAMSQPMALTATVLGLLLLKGIIVAFLAKLAGFPMEGAIRLGLYLAAGGEFAFVILGQASTAGVVDQQTAEFLQLAAGMSMALTPVLPQLTDWILNRAYAGTSVRRQNPAETEDLDGHILILGYGRVGTTVGRMLAQKDIKFHALDSNVAPVRAARARGEPVFLGDAQSNDMLELVGIERASAIVITLDSDVSALKAVRRIRERWPHIPIYARARNDHHAEELHRAGVAAIVPETLDASLRLSALVFEKLGAEPKSIDELLSAARIDYEERVREGASRPPDTKPKQSAKS
jgi:monovalent cation:H+ antiporter-2, CPA2 family